MSVKDFISKITVLAADLPESLGKGLIVSLNSNFVPNFYYYNPYLPQETNKQIDKTFKEAAEQETYKLLKKKFEPKYFEVQDLFV
jgi:hypothetical protein